jgi:hypothetical protein
MELKDIKNNIARDITELMLEVLEDNVKEHYKVEILNYMLAITVTNQEKAIAPQKPFCPSCGSEDIKGNQCQNCELELWWDEKKQQFIAC